MRWWHGLALNGVLIVLVLGIGAGIILYRKPPRLAVTGADSGAVYAQWAVKDGDTFAIEFIHSVHNSPVRETFTIIRGRICPTAVRFASFGAGMQSELAPGQKLSRDGDFMVITGFTASYKELNYIVGTVSDHILYIRDETVSLRDLCGKNAHISIRVKKRFYE